MAFLLPGEEPIETEAQTTVDSYRIVLDDYFKSYEDLEVHRLMLNDHPRTNGYHNAIFQKKHLFEGKVVMDVGAGTGILALFCARAGAQKVYAVEASGVANLAKEIVEQNELSDIIEVLQGKVEDVCLPDGEMVDVIVSEWMGFYLLHESMLNSIIVAREKFLKDEGLMFPSHATIYACPCSLGDLYKEQFDFWNNVYGFNMSSVKKHILQSKMLRPEITLIKPDELLAEPTCVRSFDLRWVTSEDVRSITDKKFVSILKDGKYQGLCLWFDCVFHEDNLSAVCTLTTAPSAPSTHWKQTVVFLPGTMKVEKDDIVGWELVLTQSEENLRHYNISVALLDPDEEHPVPCVCGAAKCKIIKAYLDKEEKDLGEEIINIF